MQKGHKKEEWQSSMRNHEGKCWINNVVEEISKPEVFLGPKIVTVGEEDERTHFMTLIFAEACTRGDDTLRP